MINNVELFGASANSVLKVDKNTSAARLMTRKEFRESKSLTASAAKAQYPDYLTEFGGNAATNVAADLAKHKWLVRKAVKNENTGRMTVDYLRADKVVTETAKVKKIEDVLSKLSDEELKAYMDDRNKVNNTLEV